MANQTDEAIGQLSKLVGPETNPYQDESHWYLSKAYFRKKDLENARKELELVVALNRQHASEARQALEKLKALGK